MTKAAPPCFPVRSEIPMELERSLLPREAAFGGIAEVRDPPLELVSRLDPPRGSRGLNPEAGGERVAQVLVSLRIDVAVVAAVDVACAADERRRARILEPRPHVPQAAVRPRAGLLLLHLVARVVVLCADQEAWTDRPRAAERDLA